MAEFVTTVSWEQTKDGRVLLKAFFGAAAIKRRILFKDISVLPDIEKNQAATALIYIEEYPQYYITPFAGNEGNVEVKFQTYSSILGKWVTVSTQTLIYPIKPNNWTKPSLSMTLAPTTPEYDFYMEEVSGVKATLSSVAKYGSRIISYKLRVEQKEYTANHPTNVISSNPLSIKGEIVVTGSVTDSRGFTTEVSQTINVTGIPQPSFDTVSCSKTTLDGIISCKYTPSNSVFYSKIYTYTKVGNTLTEIRSDRLGTATAQRTVALTLTTEELEAIYSRFTETKRATLRFTLVTYKTSEYLESARIPEEYSIDLSLDIPNTSRIQPSIDAITVSPSPMLYQDPNLYVKGKNGAKVNIVATGKYGAGVSTKWEILGKEYASGATTDNLTLAGELTITVTAVDTRGFSSSTTRKINVLDVGQPQIIVSARTLLTEPIASSITRGNAQFCSTLVFIHQGEQLEAVQIGTSNTSELTLSKTSVERVYRMNPSSNQAKITVRLLSFTDNSYKYQYGDAISQDVTLKIPDDASTKPKDISIICTPADYMAAFSDVLVNKRSKAKIAVTATGQYDAQIISYAISFDGKDYTVNGASGNVITSLLTSSNLKTIRVIATDSRGYSNTKEIQVRIYDYYSPHVGVAEGKDKAIAIRTDASGNPSDTGSYLYISASKRYADVNGRNKCMLRYRIKAGPNASYGDYTVLSGYDGNDKFSGIFNLGLDAQSVYYVELSVLDKAGETDKIILIIPTEIVYMDRSGTRDSIAFGGHVTRDRAFEVYRNAYFYSDVEFSSDRYQWKSLGLDSSVTGSRFNIGRKGSGCYIRQDATGRVQVAFNCSFTSEGNVIRVNDVDIPEDCLPKNNTISICVASSGTKAYLAGVAVTTDRQVQIAWVMDVSTGGNSASIAWIDGFIEYFVGEDKI